MNAEQLKSLETLVDQNGLRETVGALSEICGLKADHLRSNWQDEGTAKVWERDGFLLDAVSAKLRNNHGR